MLRTIERLLFVTFFSLSIFIIGTCGLLLFRTLGGKTFDSVFQQGPALLDRFGHQELVLAGILTLFGLMLFLSGIYLATQSKWLFNVVSGNGLHPSTLRVDFATTLGGCKVPVNGVDFYRLWIRPGRRLHNTNCSATLVDIMTPVPGARSGWYSFWSAERLRLAWATHTIPPETMIDLRDERGHFLDVFHVMEDGKVGFGTPGGTIAASIAALSFTPNVQYIFEISIVCDGEEPKQIGLLLVWPQKRTNVEARLVDVDMSTAYASH